MQSRTSNGLLIRLPNWVGDVMMALPTLQTLQSAGIQITLLGKPWIHDLLHGLDIPKITYPNAMKKAIQCLKNCPEQRILLLTNSFSSALAAKLAGKASMGYQQDARKFLLTYGYKKPKLAHETDIFHFLSEKIFLNWYPQLPPHRPSILIPQLPLRSQAIENAQSLLKQHSVNYPYLVLCPFAHGVNRQKQPKKWPHWKSFAKTTLDYKPIICPGPNELQEAQQHFSDALILPNLDLETYAGILKLASKIVANDSGPLHIAAAVHQQYAPIGIFGVTPPERTGPRNAKIIGSSNQWPSIDEVLEFL